LGKLIPIALQFLLEGERIVPVKKVQAKQSAFAGSGELKRAYGGIKAIEIRLEHLLPFLSFLSMHGVVQRSAEHP